VRLRVSEFRVELFTFYFVELKVEGSGFWVWDFGFGDWGSGFRISGVGIRVEGLGIRV